MPGALRTMIGGLGVFYPDGAPTQQFGFAWTSRCGRPSPGFVQGVMKCWKRPSIRSIPHGLSQRWKSWRDLMVPISKKKQ